MKKQEKFNSIINNYINGNLSIYKQQLKKLTKIELLEFLSEYKDQSPYIKVDILLRDLQV